MSLESLTTITVLMGDIIEFKKLRQCRRPYSNDALMIPYRSKELGTGTIIIERYDLEKLKQKCFKTQFNLLKFLVGVSKASYENREDPLKYNTNSRVEVHRIKDESVLLKFEDIIFKVKPLKFDSDGKYEWLQRIGVPEEE